MILQYYTYHLKFKHTFVLSQNTRTGTASVFVEILHEGETGFGEATLPPYLSENEESVLNFLGKINTEIFHPEMKPEAFSEMIDQVEPGNFSAKAALDMAWYDLYCKIHKKSLIEYWNYQNLPLPQSTFTISISNPKLIKEKLKDADNFNIIKIKLGSERDKEMIEAYKSICDKPFCVDVNQGWKDKLHALEMCEWLAEKGAFLVEQPLSKSKLDEHAWITEQSPIPVIADEAVQRTEDIEKIAGAYSGINVKLMKSGGLTEAHKMILKAKNLGMKVLLGCMSESSCGVSAAAHLSPLVDWADLDGPYLISNDPFDGMKIVEGEVFLPKRPGIGVELKRIREL